MQQRYANGAQEREAALCCPVEYDPQYLRVIPQEVIERDYGCGDPSQYLRPGETVLDLGVHSSVAGESTCFTKGCSLHPRMARRATCHRPSLASFTDTMLNVPRGPRCNSIVVLGLAGGGVQPGLHAVANPKTHRYHRALRVDIDHHRIAFEQVVALRPARAVIGRVAADRRLTRPSSK